MDRLANVVCSLIIFGLMGLILFGTIAFINHYYNQEKWCEKCNTWQRMSRRFGQIEGWDCPKCKWTSQAKVGTCPRCGWYGKYANGTVSRRGPFKKVDRTPITPFYGVQEEYSAYEEKIKCPKHGIFTAYIPVDEYQSAYHHQQDDYEDQYYDDHEYYDDEYHPSGSY
jgi:hypothetical protein